MKNLVIFGAGDVAELAFFYFNRNNEYRLKAFVVDPDFVTSNSFCGLPVITTECVLRDFPPSETEAFVAMGYSSMNKNRIQKYQFFKNKGYKLASYISPKCTNFASSIGDNCFILEDNTLQPFTRVGSNVTLWSGNHIGHHSVIEDHCFITSHVVVSGRVVVGEGCFIGVNATIRDNIKIGSSVLIGAGALILKDCSPNQVFKGNKSLPEQILSSEVGKI